MIFVKMLIEHGKFHSDRTNIIDRSIAITHLHQAVELIIKLRIKEKKLGINESEFEKILNILKPSATNTPQLQIPYWSDIFDLNRQRNNVYHNGLIHVPDTKVVFHFSKITESFMTEFLKNEYSINYDDLSLIDLIEDIQIKDKLSLAQKNKNSDLKLAITNIDQALYYVITKVLAKLGVYNLTAGGGFMIQMPDGSNVNRDVLLAQALLFGEDYEKIAMVQFISQRKSNQTIDDYDKIFPLVVEIARKSEEKYGDFSKIIPPWDKQ